MSVSGTLFLTDEQLEDLTGLSQPAAQKRWLISQGVPYYVRADGRLRVVVAALTQERLEVHGAPPQEPNFGALARRS